MYTPLHPSSSLEWRAVVAACVLVNVIILLLNQHILVEIRVLIFIISAVCMIYLKPQARGRLFAITAIVCMLTVIHATVSFYVSDIIWHGMMMFRYQFYAQEQTSATSMGTFHDRDHSIAHGAAILTHETQAEIHASQSRCHSNMTVYQVHRYMGGMGAELHWQASALAFALDQTDALFAWGDGACETYCAHCRDLYEREHACTAEEIGQMRIISLTNKPTLTAPARFMARLPESFTIAQVDYWWRAQAIGYLMRFNTNTTHQVAELRARLHGNTSLSGAINVNIRSGDKTSEARLSPTEHYIDTALALITLQPLGFSRVLFLTSDSLHEILQARAYAKTKQLHVLYSDIPRMKYGNDQDTVGSFWTYNITISVLMQLSMAAECDAWIGTRSSNWNRIIDMYRCTRVNKCKQMFLEAGDTLEGHYDSNPTVWV